MSGREHPETEVGLAGCGAGRLVLRDFADMPQAAELQKMKPLGKSANLMPMIGDEWPGCLQVTSGVM